MLGRFVIVVLSLGLWGGCSGQAAGGADAAPRDGGVAYDVAADGPGDPGRDAAGVEGGAGDAADAGAAPDDGALADGASDDAPTPLTGTIVLVTPSPGLELAPVVAGTLAGDGADAAVVSIFVTTDAAAPACSGTPVSQVLAADYAAGVAVPVGADSSTSLSALAEGAAGDGVCLGRVVYVHHGDAWSRLTFADEFRGPQPDDDPACFAIPPQCIAQYLGGPGECPESHPGLAALDKCKWTILRQPNWMSNDYGPDASGLNALMPQEVRVEPDTEDGVLVLSARSYKWDGTLLPAPATPEGQALAATFAEPQTSWLQHYDCRWNAGTTTCPILSGAIYSRRYGSYFEGGVETPRERGFTQEHGRFEIRAKLPFGPGSFPAHWMLPQDGSWPERGEIDIMEAGRDATYAYQTYHTGYCDGASDPNLDDHQACQALKGSGARRLHLARGGRAKEHATKPGDLVTNWHVYRVEWSPARLQFFVDDVMTLEVKDGDPAYGSLTDFQSRASGVARPLRMPHGDFYLLLNQTVHNDDGGQVQPLGFAPQEMRIDWVRAYGRCAAPADFCPTGGAFDGRDGLCHPADPGDPAYASPCTRAAGSPVPAGTFDACVDPCPFGGWFDTCNCQVLKVPQKRADAGDCPDCGQAWIETFADQSQHLYYTYVLPNPTWADAALACTDRLAYAVTGQIEDVSIGQFDGAHCNVSPALDPAGLYPTPFPYPEVYFVWPASGSTIYYHPRCHSHGECGY